MDVIYWIVYRIADVHEAILHWNDAWEANFTDKELHFLVFGFAGLGVYLTADWAFRRLVRRGLTGMISWGYTLTLILGITFAIEIGQYFTGTGTLDLQDLISGVVGFVLFSLLYIVLRGILRWVFHGRYD